MPVNVKITCVPGEVGDAEDQRDGCGHLIEWQGEIDLVGQPDPHTEDTDQAVQHDRRAAEHPWWDGRDRGAHLADTATAGWPPLPATQ